MGNDLYVINFRVQYVYFRTGFIQQVIICLGLVVELCLISWSFFPCKHLGLFEVFGAVIVAGAVGELTLHQSFFIYIFRVSGMCTSGYLLMKSFFLASSDLAVVFG